MPDQTKQYEDKTNILPLIVPTCHGIENSNGFISTRGENRISILNTFKLLIL